MRREHRIITGGEIIQPVFYAPLTQGDVTDHISGISIGTVSPNNGSYSWDSSLGAYHFIKNSGRGGAAAWKGLSMGLYDGSIRNKIKELTIHFEYYVPTTDANLARTVFIGGYTNSSTSVRSGWTGSVANQWAVQEGAYSQFGIGFAYSGSNPYVVNQMVSIGMSDTTSSNQKTNCWIRNIVIWNKLLTNQQIQDFLNAQ